MSQAGLYIFRTIINGNTFTVAMKSAIDNCWWKSNAYHTLQLPLEHKSSFKSFSMARWFWILSSWWWWWWWWWCEKKHADEDKRKIVPLVSRLREIIKKWGVYERKKDHRWVSLVWENLQMVRVNCSVRLVIVKKKKKVREIFYLSLFLT